MKKSPYHLEENLSGMKMLRTVNGNKYINTDKRPEIEGQVQALVTKHRARLIETVLSGIPQYVGYRFHMRIASFQKQELTNALRELQKVPVPLDECEMLVEELIKKDQAVVEYSSFYHEIDQIMKKQLRIV